MKKELLKLKIDGYLKDGNIYEDKNFHSLVPPRAGKRANLLAGSAPLRQT